jgi:hypothetical protein
MASGQLLLLQPELARPKRSIPPASGQLLLGDDYWTLRMRPSTGQGAGATASAAIYLLLHMELVGRRHLIIDPAGVRRHRVPATELACLHGRESFALGPVGDAGGRQLCTSSVVAGGRRVADGGRRSAGDNTIFCFLSDLGID